MRYQSNRPRRQFLAGVKCPSCGALDKIVQVQIFEPAFDEYIECTECGHTERRPTPADLPNITNAATHAEHITLKDSLNLGDISPIKFIP